LLGNFPIATLDASALLPPVMECSLTQLQLGWRPTQPGLIADLERGQYFDAYAASLRR
jgi:hypothetical protein